MEPIKNEQEKSDKPEQKYDYLDVLDDIDIHDDENDVEIEHFHSAFPILNRKGMPWAQGTSSEEEEEDEGYEETMSSLHVVEIGEESLHLVQHLLLKCTWKGNLCMSIPMFGIQKLIGGSYILNLFEIKDSTFHGIDTYDENDASVTLSCIIEKNCIFCNFENSDGIHFRGVMDIKTRILKGKCHNSDTPQGTGNFEIKGYDRL